MGHIRRGYTYGEGYIEEGTYKERGYTRRGDTYEKETNMGGEDILREGGGEIYKVRRIYGMGIT